MAGRPTKRTPETEAKICNALRAGASRKDAAGASGINEATFGRWLHFADFARAVLEAESSCATRMSVRLYQEATKEDGDWRACLEWLKRRRKEEWSERTEKDVTTNGKDIGSCGIEIVITGVVEDEPGHE